MTIVFIHTENGVSIKGDEQVLERATLGNGNIPAESLNIEGITVNAQNLATLFDKASTTGPLYDKYDELAGYPRAKCYVQLREKFIRQQELAKAYFDEPTQSHAPSITTPAMKPVVG